LFLAKVARLPEDFLMGDGPCDTSDGYRQNEQPGELEANRHG